MFMLRAALSINRSITYVASGLPEPRYGFVGQVVVKTAREIA
jgi:hypothetical protein